MERGGGELEKTNLVFTIRLREGKLREGFYIPYFMRCDRKRGHRTGGYLWQKNYQKEVR